MTCMSCYSVADPGASEGGMRKISSEFMCGQVISVQRSQN